VLARSAKFSLFDPAKEMVYIEMTKEEKNQGKVRHMGQLCHWM
jgi:ATP/ADP translocase